MENKTFVDPDDATAPAAPQSSTFIDPSDRGTNADDLTLAIRYASQSGDVRMVKVLSREIQRIQSGDVSVEQSVGGMTPQEIETARTKQDPIGDHLAAAAYLPKVGESGGDRSKRLYGGLKMPEDVGMGEGILRSAVQGPWLGYGEEATAAAAAVKDKLTGENPDRPVGELYDRYVMSGRGKLANFRGKHPVISAGAEMAGAAPWMFVPPAAAISRVVQGMGMPARRRIDHGRY